MESMLPLRDRKKAKQREALADAAIRLFLRKGYSATTLEEISAACDVTVPTLLRYFGSKEDLLFARQPAFLEKAAKGIEQAIAKKTVVSTWLHFLHNSAENVVGNREITNMYEIIVNAPPLLAKFYAIVRQYEEMLDRALSREMGVEPGEDMHCSLLAHLLVFGPVEEALRAIRQGDLGSVVSRMAKSAKYVLDNFKRPATKPEEGSGKGQQKITKIRRR